MNLGNFEDFNLENFQAQLDQMASWPKPVRQGLAPAFFVLLVIGWVWLFAIPSNQELDRLKALEAEKQVELQKATSVAENLPAFKAETERLETQLQGALRQLPDSKEIPGLLTDISMRGKSAGLDIESFKPGAEINRGFYAEVPLDLEFRGTFHQVVRFFDSISKLKRIVNVGELRISVDDEGSDETVLNVEGKATTFQFVEQPASASKGGPA